MKLNGNFSNGNRNESRMCCRNLPLVNGHSVSHLPGDFNFMQIILTKSNNIKFEKQIGHLVLFSLVFLLLPLFRSSVCGTYVQRAWGFSGVRWPANTRWCVATDSVSKFHMANWWKGKGGLCGGRVRVCAARDEIIANNFHKFVILCFCGCCCRFGCYLLLCPD